MNKTFLYFCTFIFITSCSSQTKLPINNADQSFRVMTYNVHHCNPPSKEAAGTIELDTIANVIKLQQPDLVALQEIDDHTQRSGNFNEAEEIAKKLNMHFYFGKAIDYGGGGYGVAILAKFPLSEMTTTALPSVAGFTGEVRVLCTATVALPNGKTIRFASTHLEVKSKDNRELQVKEILRIAALERIPFVIGGDFNDPVESVTIKILDQDFQRTCTRCDFTIPVDRPNKTIDHIAYSKTAQLSVVDHQVIKERYASDHLPVVATLRFN